MQAEHFLDTNILVYYFDQSRTVKQLRAKECVVNALNGSGCTSTQVLGEFASLMLHKFRREPSHVGHMLAALSPLPVMPIHTATVQRAVDVHRTYGVHYYDAIVIATAERAGCSRLITEDLNDGQVYFGVTVHNPFAGL